MAYSVFCKILGSYPVFCFVKEKMEDPKLYPDSFITCLGYNKSECIFFRNKIMLKIK